MAFEVFSRVEHFSLIDLWFKLSAFWMEPLKMMSAAKLEKI